MELNSFFYSVTWRTLMLGKKLGSVTSSYFSLWCDKYWWLMNQRKASWMNYMLLPLYVVQWHDGEICLHVDMFEEWDMLKEIFPRIDPYMAMMFNFLNWFWSFEMFANMFAGKLLSILLCCKSPCYQITLMEGTLMCGRSKFTALDRASPYLFLAR